MTTTSAVPAPRRPADAAREEALVRQHLPVVGYVVNEMIGRLPAHVRRDDLVAAGLAALAFAARSWDPGAGVPFGRYANPRVRGALIDELRSQDWASRGARARARAVNRTGEQLAAALGREPSDAETAAALGLSEAEVSGSRADVQRAVVMSLQGLGETGDPVAEQVRDADLGPEGRLLAAERLGYLTDAIACLPERLRAVVQGYYLDERPMAELAAELGVTESRVSQLRAEALVLLRGALDAGLDAAPGPAGGAAAPEAGVAARRRHAYYAEVASRSAVATRLDAGSVLLAAGTTRTASA